MNFLSILALNFLLVASISCQVCNIYCDGRESELSTGPRFMASTEVWLRKISLFISDVDNMGYGKIENGDPGDELWLDRTFDGGVSWTDGTKLGNTVIPAGETSTLTNSFNVDVPSERKLGGLRVCGKASNRPEISCTSWFRSFVQAERRVDAAATALMQFYDERGLWKTTGWWNAANCLTAIIDYEKISERDYYSYAIDETFEKNKDKEDGNFTNLYIDDTLWWGLAWVGAYDLTGNNKYLDMAIIDSDYSYAYRDDHCGGGLWWTTRKDYKNAIPNELFIKLAAALHNRIPGDEKFLNQGLEVWNWFKNSGMINEENLINDGLTDLCESNRDTTWTYNQGVILGGLVELYHATGDYTFIDEAKKIADAVVGSSLLSPNGILTEPCERDGGDCGADGPSFKGIFMRNLGELDREIGKNEQQRPYLTYILTQDFTLWEKGRNSFNQFGLRYGGLFDKADAARQHSAFEAFIAASDAVKHN